MQASILRPCAMITTESGGATKRLKSGDIVEGDAEWEVRAINSLINSGYAIEVQGNGEPVEVKKKITRKKKVSRKKADATD